MTLTLRANPSGFSGRLLTSIYKQKIFTLKIDHEIIQKLNFYISSVILILRKCKVGRYVYDLFRIYFMASESESQEPTIHNLFRNIL